MIQASNGYNSHLQQLHSYISWQADKINKLETNVEEIKKELTDFRNQKQISVDKIEYRFDLLKVENLNGTLVIGVTPDGAKSIEEMAKNGYSVVHSSKDKHSELYDSTSNTMEHYLKSEVPGKIDSISKQFQLNVDHEYRQRMTNDLKKQLHDRIHHYMNQVDHDKDLSTSKQFILDHVKRDIQIAIEQHLESIQNHKKGVQTHDSNDSRK
ncbi:spore germination protein GerPC [Paenibacillus guangzhouensis]|uniref:spore germination protein GerPC n=1 Tax=Paenibacillus guangzhouensis TaxID=1473112 RepID=UPI0012671BD2|nr:spore germination protein GerPC [Paenibacillus guangzhouensis]